MTELATYREPGLAIDRFGFAEQTSQRGSASRRTRAARQFPIPLLRISVPMTVHMVDTGLVALALEDLELIDVAVARNQ